jgi:hypothetical protein
MADTEENLLNYEHSLVQYLRDDPRRFQAVPRGFGPQHFRNARLASTYCDLEGRYKAGKLPLPNDALLGCTHVRRATIALRDAQGRPTPTACEQPQQPPQATREPRSEQGQSTPRPDRRRHGKKFLELRSGARRSDLNVLLKYLARPTTRKALEALFPGRDLLDPDEAQGVSAAEIGQAVSLACEEMFHIEALATLNGRQLGWCRKRKGKKLPYLFTFRTIACVDRTVEDVKKLRKSRANERAYHSRRATATQAFQQPPRSWSDVRSVDAARIKAKEDSILEILANGSARTISDLMKALKFKPAWRELAGNRASFRRVMSRHLDSLQRKRKIRSVFEERIRRVSMFSVCAGQSDNQTAFSHIDGT